MREESTPDENEESELVKKAGQFFQETKGCSVGAFDQWQNPSGQSIFQHRQPLDVSNKISRCKRVFDSFVSVL